jgi:hypothetical protein
MAGRYVTAEKILPIKYIFYITNEMLVWLVSNPTTPAIDSRKA